MLAVYAFLQAALSVPDRAPRGEGVTSWMLALVIIAGIVLVIMAFLPGQVEAMAGQIQSAISSALGG